MSAEAAPEILLEKSGYRNLADHSPEKALWEAPAHSKRLVTNPPEASGPPGIRSSLVA
jgi:hypothetical protein